MATPPGYPYPPYPPNPYAQYPYGTPADPSIPTKDECTMAFLAHLLQVFTGFIAPLVIFCVKNDSRFVKFHALQSLIWQLCYMAVFFGGFSIVFFGMFATIFEATAKGPANAPPTALFLFFPLFWVVAMGLGVLNLVLGILYGIKANRGEWAGYPILGSWLRKKYMPVPQYPPAQPSAQAPYTP